VGVSSVAAVAGEKEEEEEGGLGYNYFTRSRAAC
jgi:hypothetical protein